MNQPPRAELAARQDPRAPRPRPEGTSASAWGPGARGSTTSHSSGAGGEQEPELVAVQARDALSGQSRMLALEKPHASWLCANPVCNPVTPQKTANQSAGRQDP